jgi:histidinol dehydrogenase
MSVLFDKFKKAGQLSLEIFQKEMEDGSKALQENIEQNLDSIISKLEKHKQKQTEKGAGEEK